MRAHDAEDVIVVIEEGQKEGRCETAFPMMAMNDKLGDPEHLTAVTLPAASKGVTRQDSINSDSGVAAL